MWYRYFHLRQHFSDNLRQSLQRIHPIQAFDRFGPFFVLWVKEVFKPLEIGGNKSPWPDDAGIREITRAVSEPIGSAEFKLPVAFPLPYTLHPYDPTIYIRLLQTIAIIKYNLPVPFILLTQQAFLLEAVLFKNTTASRVTQHVVRVEPIEPEVRKPASHHCMNKLAHVTLPASG